MATFESTGRKQRARSDGSGERGRRGPSKGIDETIEAKLKAMGMVVEAKLSHFNHSQKQSLFDALGAVLVYPRGNGDEHGKLDPYYVYTMQQELNLGVALTASAEVRVSQCKRNSTMHTVKPIVTRLMLPFAHLAAC